MCAGFRTTRSRSEPSCPPPFTLLPYAQTSASGAYASSRSSKRRRWSGFRLSFRIAKFLVQGSFEPAGVSEKVRHQGQSFLGESFAVVVRRAVAIVAIREPAFDSSGFQHPVFGSMTKNVLVAKFIHGARVSHIILDGFAEKFAGCFQCQLETFHDGVSINLVVNAVLWRGLQLRQ